MSDLSRTALFLLVTACLALPGGLSADTIILHSGETIENVRTFVGGGAIFVVHQDGTVASFTRGQIRSLRRSDVDWNPEQTIVEPTTEPELPPDEPGSEESGLRSPFDLVWRSAVFPGWGHVHAGQSTTGIVYGALFWSAAILAAVEYGAVADAKAAYEQESTNAFLVVAAVGQSGGTGLLLYSLSANNAAFDSYSREASRFAVSAGALALVYAFQLAHAYYSGVDWVNAGLVTPEGEQSWNLELRPEHPDSAIARPASSRFGQRLAVTWSLQF
ncbi:MAG: hypothetical protein KDK35_10430 [Leptospiraceae bacterium]|nr:hypothetical protein [Leptospiraceae bacterium]MCP5484365.1 hypothetical protein [Spirochaetales bacterium]